mgnify:FL=1
MFEEYQKETNIKDKTDEDKKVELIMSLIKAKKELNLATKNFETAEEGLVDYYVYQIKASKSKVDFLVNKAKDKGLSLNMIEEFYLKKNKVEKEIFFHFF